MRQRSPRQRTSGLIYALLFLYIAVSLCYHTVASVSLIIGYFDLRRQVQEPFQMDWYRPTVSSPGTSAKQHGLEAGDTVETIDGEPFRGRAQLQSDRWYAHPGGVMRVGVRKPAGSRSVIEIPLSGYSVKVGFGEAIFVVVLHIVLPLFCLVLGYWVALARPWDPNAWFILVLLSYPESFIAVHVYNWWPGIWLVLRLAWHLILAIMAPVALLWLGLLFPERSRIDIRAPWLKWVVLAVQSCGLVAELTTDYSSWYSQAFLPQRRAIESIVDPVILSVTLLCIVLYWIAIFAKLRTASTPDAQRRLRVLCVGSAVGLGSTLIIWGVLPRFGIDPAAIEWLGYLDAVLLLAFPLSLAYVVVVQRAMDVRILMRMGTRYILARTTVGLLQVGIVAFLIVHFLIPMIRRHENYAIYVVLPVVLIVLFVRLNVAPRGIGDRVKDWLDRRFFREAYNAEIVLSDLAERIRRISDPAALIATISNRVSEVLHITQMAVLLRSGGTFRVSDGAISLPENSPPVQHLIRTASPAVLYRDQPEEWFIRSSGNEKEALDELRAEVLLPMPGREKLMGVMVLGPKRSEEPYSPTDLRLLASVGAQAGLSLEVNDLAQSLAHEEARRELIQREVEIAREVQERLFPQRVPQVPGTDLAGYCRPAFSVGGDYYDMIELEDGRLALAIGDVSGKGIAAALLMAGLRASLRGMTDGESHDLARMMRKMNRLIYESSAVNRYATFFFAIYDPATRTLRYVNAGHNPPLVIRQSNCALRLEASGPVIGLLPKVEYEERSAQLTVGDLFLGYTDGISEAMTKDDEEWGEERMLEAAAAVRGSSAGEALRELFEAVDRFTAGAPQHDDMTVLICKLTGQA